MNNTDKYLYFSFNGVDSSSFRCFYENNGEDLSFPAFPAFSNTIITPMFQPYSYFGGTSMKNKIFQLKCAAERLTLGEFRRLERWLNKDTIGWLKFDFLPDYHFLVKVDSFSNALLLPVDETKTIFHAEFTVNFTTVEDTAAISDFLYKYNLNDDNSTSTILDFDYRLPVIDFKSNNSIRLFNMKPYSCYPKLSIYDTNAINIKLFAKKYYKLLNSEKVPVLWYQYLLDGTKYNIELDSKYGYIQNANTGRLIEESFLDNLSKQDTFINNGAFEIESGNIQQHKLTLTNVTPSRINGPELRLTFTSNEPHALNDFDFGRRSQNDEGKGQIIENNNFKGVFIQNEGFDQYPLFNEGPYGNGYYYVDGQYTFYSYYFIKEGSELTIVLNNLGNNLQDFDKYIRYFQSHLQDSFLVSICDYTEIDFNTYYQQGDFETPSINNIEFNLRTIF